MNPDLSAIVHTATQAKQCDELAITQFDMEGKTLLENAGDQVAEVLLQQFQPCPTLILCGPGNNGGDGYVVANHLRTAGFEVTLLQFGAPKNGSAAEMIAKEWQGKAIAFDEKKAISLLKSYDLYVDAIFGTGLSRTLPEPLLRFIQALNQVKAPIISIDIPTGVDAETGQLHGGAIKATHTVTFTTRKVGHMLFPGRAYAGEVIVKNIGLPEKLLTTVVPYIFRNIPDLWQSKLPLKKAAKQLTMHKHQHGKLMVASDAESMTGATRLAALGAARTGVGIVHLAVPEATAMVYTLTQASWIIHKNEKAETLRELLKQVKPEAVLVGPGFGLDSQIHHYIEIMLKSRIACVLDADALTAYAGQAEELGNLVKGPLIITPHEGEFARLFPNLKGSKIERAGEAAHILNGIVVLKGADTVIAAPSKLTVINDNAPWWLATAGSGDILAGMIAGFLAQGMPAFDAACAATWIHSEAANAFGPGMIAEDILPQLPKILTRWL